jgi:hypothetical protein
VNRPRPSNRCSSATPANSDRCLAGPGPRLTRTAETCPASASNTPQRAYGCKAGWRTCAAQAPPHKFKRVLPVRAAASHFPRYCIPLSYPHSAPTSVHLQLPNQLSWLACLLSWTLRGTLGPTGQDGVKFELDFVSAAPRQANARYETRIAGVWQNSAPPLVFSGAMNLRGWQVYRIESVVKPCGVRNVSDGVRRPRWVFAISAACGDMSPRGRLNAPAARAGSAIEPMRGRTIMQRVGLSAVWAPWSVRYVVAPAVGKISAEFVQRLDGCGWRPPGFGGTAANHPRNCTRVMRGIRL